jgi:hypothetical protein
MTVTLQRIMLAGLLGERGTVSPASNCTITGYDRD